MARRKVFQRAAPRRRSTWEGSAIAASMTTGVQTQQAIVSEALLENVPNPTVVRMRGELLVRVTAAGAAGATARMVMGIKLATASAFAAGGASVESPNTEIGGDWIWWQSVTMHNAAALVSGSNNDNVGILTRVPIDSKSMRKVKINEVLILVFHNVVVGGTQSITVTGTVRVLLKL